MDGKNAVPAGLACKLLFAALLVAMIGCQSQAEDPPPDPLQPPQMTLPVNPGAVHAGRAAAGRLRDATRDRDPAEHDAARRRRAATRRDATSRQRSAAGRAHGGQHGGAAGGDAHRARDDDPAAAHGPGQG